MQTEEKNTENVTAISTRPVGSIATVDVRDASDEGVKLMRARVENQKQMLKIAIGLTSASQWTVFEGKNGATVYPTGGAADTILRRAFGLTWGEKRVTIERDEDGVVAVCRAWLRQGDINVEEFEGRRYMGGFVQNEAAMRKGAVENMKSVAVRDLLGLRFRSPDELRELGLDVGKLERRAEFRSHGKDEVGGAVVPWGKLKDTPVSELNDKQIEYYVDKANEAIADPEKAKWRAREEKWLAALRAEQAARTKKSGGDAKDHASNGEVDTTKDWNGQ